MKATTKQRKRRHDLVNRLAPKRIREKAAEAYASLAPPKEGRPPTVFYYIRFSSVDQADGCSVDHQLAALEDVYRRDFEPKGYVLAPPYIDAATSAYKVPFADRPNGKRLLADVQEGDAILAYKGDRLFRSLIDLAGTMDRLKVQGVRVRVGDMAIDYGTPEGKLFFQILGSFAEYDSALKGARTAAGKRASMLKGNQHGEPPTGGVVVKHEGLRRKVIKREYVDLFDWIAEKLRDPEWSYERISKEAARRAAEIEGYTPKVDETHGFGVDAFKKGMGRRFRNWSKATGPTITTIDPFTRQPKEVRWLYPLLPKKEKKA